MDKNYTHIVLVVDRSGSMEDIRTDAEGGINSLIREQKEQDGRATLTLVQFDSQQPYDPVHNCKDLKEVNPDYKLVPRGGTPLYDAIGRAINEAGAFLSGLPEEKRPALVTFVIATDGYENASREFSGAKIKEMVQHQEQKYSWSFQYIGANQDAVLVGSTLGISAAKSASYTLNNAAQAYKTSSGKLSVMRGMVAGGASANVASNSPEASYNALDRAQLMDPNAGSLNVSVPSLSVPNFQVSEPDVYKMPEPVQVQVFSNSPQP